ncbi:DUF2254 domain-containing protein [Adhaeribacter aquaticus]|uniref:DUF2254 domain-containing protein n=1 Tax=Adhaeribacter aquaticus TaxID=299567 RepID=UPI0012F79ECF|nr:DUF2254 domain-containing protein [Adhaeribacter aquaticus]
MERFPKVVKKTYFSITSSIAFWPTIIACSYFVLAICIWYFEGTRLSSFLESKIPIFKNLKEDVDNARLLLNILASGTITLTVFSFSMVMIVLSQASSNLSPRVIPGLVSDKSHQVVLGVNVGTIIYSLFLILSFKPGKSNATIPVIGILLGLVFGILCLALFVYFIHSISKSIQVDTIIKRIYRKALQEFKREGEISIEDHTDEIVIEKHDWVVFGSVESGYLRRVEKDVLLEFVTDHDLLVEVMVPLGTFMVIGKPFLKFNRDVSQVKNINDIIYQCFIFSKDEMVTPDYEYNFRQITEIAVKALSPGINDPGTAYNAIDFMTLLLAERLKTKETTYLYDQNKKVRVILSRSSMDKLLFNYLTPIRTYGKNDVMVILKLLDCLKTLIHLNKKEQTYYPELLKHAFAIREDADEFIRNREDRKRVNEMLNQLQETCQVKAGKIALENLTITST